MFNHTSAAKRQCATSLPYLVFSGLQFDYYTILFVNAQRWLCCRNYVFTEDETMLLAYVHRVVTFDYFCDLSHWPVQRIDYRSL